MRLNYTIERGNIVKNQNGAGSVYKMSGNRRKPWMVRVTIGFEIVDGKKKQIRKLLGSYKTERDAQKALLSFGDGLIDPERVGMTFKELYEAWSEKHFKNIGHHTIESYTTGYNGWSVYHNERFDSLKHSHFQKVLDDTSKTYSSKSKMRTVVRMMAEYAILNDIIIKDYTEGLTIGKSKTQKEKVPFSEKEIKQLWDKLDEMDNVDLILINIYTGMRPSELMDVRAEDVSLDERWLKWRI